MVQTLIIKFLIGILFIQNVHLAEVDAETAAPAQEATVVSLTRLEDAASQ